MIPHFDLTISRLPDIVQKRFCTPDETMEPNFQVKYGLALLQVCSQKN